MKKNTAIVLGGSFDLSFAIGAFLINLKKYSPNLADDIIIYHDNISEKDQEIMNSIIPVKFIKFELNEKLNNIDTFVRERFSDLIFFKYECLKLLNEYKTVIVTDFDVLLLDDISEIAIPKNNNVKCKMLKDFIEIIGGDLSHDILNEPSFKYDKDMFVMGAGLIVFYDTIKNIDELYNYCLDKTMQYSKYFVPHQANLRIMQAVAKRIGLPMEKVSVVLNKFGNCSSASIGLALTDALEENKINDGDLVLLTGFGGGFTWGSSLMIW